MMYSSALFRSDNDSLLQASTAKLDLICQKLQLNENDHVIEIGTGWGGFAIHAAKHYGCRVTTTTISQQQHDFAKEKIKSLGLEDTITLLQDDYRDLKGRYTKLVSIEMIEAVGHQYYNQFFKKCSELLDENGRMLIQAITINEQRYEEAKNEVDFIQRYIFPGGSLPSNTAIQNGITQYTDMRLVHMQEIGISYAKTLERWRETFLSKRSEVKEQGFSDTFVRMWEYYFSYCEGGFLERSIGCSHLVYNKPYCQLPDLGNL
jgi:cyclopropane-fatty-acyl-phospholipid synthase